MKLTKEQFLKGEMLKWVECMNPDNPEEFNSYVMELQDMIDCYIEKYSKENKYKYLEKLPEIK